MKRSSFLFFMALFFLVLVLADLILWFVATDAKPDFESAKAHYLSHYPEAMQNARVLTVISLLLLTVAGFLFLNASKERGLKVVASLLGMIAAMLIMWKIFSLM
ncbi:MAG: hypothetical protein ACO1N9_10055 [Flavobacterium sp.]